MPILYKEKIQQKFFDKLAVILEKEFPKGICKERSQALVLNAFANIFLKDALDAIIDFYEKKQTSQTLVLDNKIVMKKLVKATKPTKAVKKTVKAVKAVTKIKPKAKKAK